MYYYLTNTKYIECINYQNIFRLDFENLCIYKCKDVLNDKKFRYIKKDELVQDIRDISNDYIKLDEIEMWIET